MQRNDIKDENVGRVKRKWNPTLSASSSAPLDNLNMHNVARTESL